MCGMPIRLGCPHACLLELMMDAAGTYTPIGRDPIKASVLTIHDPQQRVPRGKKVLPRAPPTVVPGTVKQFEQPTKAVAPAAAEPTAGAAAAAAPPAGAAGAAADWGAGPPMSPPAGAEWLYPLSDSVCHALRMRSSALDTYTLVVVVRQTQCQGVVSRQRHTSVAVALGP